MTEPLPPSEVLQAYLQADADHRTAHFAEFIRALKIVASENGDAAARGWARQAVSPLVDYSCLIKLHRFLIDSGSASGGGNAKRLRLAILGGPTTIQLRQLVEVFAGRRRHRRRRSTKPNMASFVKRS